MQPELDTTTGKASLSIFKRAGAVAIPVIRFLPGLRNNLYH